MHFSAKHWDAASQSLLFTSPALSICVLEKMKHDCSSTVSTHHARASCLHCLMSAALLFLFAAPPRGRKGWLQKRELLKSWKLLRRERLFLRRLLLRHRYKNGKLNFSTLGWFITGTCWHPNYRNIGFVISDHLMFEMIFSSAKGSPTVPTYCIQKKTLNRTWLIYSASFFSFFFKPLINKWLSPHILPMWWRLLLA